MIRRSLFGLALLLALPVQAATTAPKIPTRADMHPQLRGDETQGLHFTLKQAEDYALANHPQIAEARYNADAVRQQIREARSAFFPQVSAESDSVWARDGVTRLAAPAGLSDSAIYSRQSDGVIVSQLITDFGHTYDLTESAHFRANAAEDRVNTARALILLQVDRAYFDLLRAQAVLRVAHETVQARQTAYDQISALAGNQLKSALDVNFADVNLSQAKLLLIQARSGIANAEAELSTSLGFPDAEHFILTEEPLATNLPASPEPLIQEARDRRPELAALRNEDEAAQKFAQAQVAAQYPKITALGAAGVNPISNHKVFTDTYYTAGVNVEVPILNGGNLDAHVQEARALAEAAGKNLVDVQNTISRDVRMAWENASTEKDNLAVTAEMVRASQQEQSLAQARYRLGTSSIVELIQAQLDYTQAQLQAASARYGFQSGLSLLHFATGQGF